MDTDLLDSLLSLEDEFYEEGHALGSIDGARAGHLEGKAFGLEKGFEKFFEIGIIQGKATVWATRLSRTNHNNTSNSELESPTSQTLPSQDMRHLEPRRPTLKGASRDVSTLRLSFLPVNPRLEKHVKTLLVLADPSTLCMENTEESIAEFDDRLRKAQAKVKIIERLIGEVAVSDLPESANAEAGYTRKGGDKGDGTGNIEDISSLRVRH